MSDGLMDVVVGVYRDVDAAQKDFDGLVGLVKGKKVKIEGAILVSRDAEGEITIADTGNHLGRKGAGWGGGVGVIVGLFAPAMLPAVAVGAAAGAIAGKFVNHKLNSGIQGKIGENLPNGSAAVIVMASDDQRLPVEQALSGSTAKSVAQSDEGGIRELKSSLAEAMGKFAPDRTVLPLQGPDVRRHGRPYDRRVRARLDDLRHPEAARGRAKRAGRDHRRRRLRQSEHVRRAHRDARAVACSRDGARLQPLPRHGHLLADSLRVAHRPQSAPRRLRLDRRVPGARSRATPPRCRRAARLSPAC